MLITERENVNKYIDEHTCKGTIKRNLGKDILLVVNNFNPVFKSFEDILIEKGYAVTIVEKVQKLNIQLTKKANLIYVDCCINFGLLDCVISTREPKMLVVAIMTDGFRATETLFAKQAYDYITTSISSVELIHKTTLYMLYSAACRLKIFDDKMPRLSSKVNKNKENNLVNLACNHLLKNMPSYTSLDKLCRLLGTNRNTLAIAFKNQLGMGAYSWLRNARILKASKLLKLSDINIQSICFEVGYENAANFSTTFKSITGMSPKQYRKLHNQNFQ